MKGFLCYSTSCMVSYCIPLFFFIKDAIEVEMADELEFRALTLYFFGLSICCTKLSR